MQGIFMLVNPVKPLAAAEHLCHVLDALCAHCPYEVIKLFRVKRVVVFQGMARSYHVAAIMYCNPHPIKGLYNLILYLWNADLVMKKRHKMTELAFAFKFQADLFQYLVNLLLIFIIHME